MDTALLSQIERGDRPIKKEQIKPLSKILKAGSDELTALWLAHQLMDVLKDEKFAGEALKKFQKILRAQNNDAKPLQRAYRIAGIFSGIHPF